MSPGVVGRERWATPVRACRGGPQYKVYRNIAYHAGKWFALAAPTHGAIDVKASANVEVVTLPTADAGGVVDNLQVGGGGAGCRAVRGWIRPVDCASAVVLLMLTACSLYDMLGPRHEHA